MTQLAVSDQLMEQIASAAQSCGRTPETLLNKIFTEIMETDEGFAERILTPEVGQQMLTDLRDVDQGNITTSEKETLSSTPSSAVFVPEESVSPIACRDK